MTIEIQPVPRDGGVREWLKYLLFFAPAHLAAGVALGGFAATIGATAWWLQSTGRINLWEHVDKMDKLVIVNTPASPRTIPPPRRSRVRWADECRDGRSGSSAGGGSGGRGSGDDDAGDRKPSKLEIPVPLTMALLGWTASVLWAATRTAYRSRLDLTLRTFFHDVNFSLCAKRNGRIAQRRIASRPLLSTMYNNDFLAATVRTACGKVTATNPVVRMPAREAWLVVTALQGPLSEVSGSDHLQCDGDRPGAEAKFWFALTCSPSTFRTVVISDDLVQELAAAVDEGGSGPEIEVTMHHGKRKTSRTVMAVVSAVREVQSRKATPGPPPNNASEGELVPLVGWLNLPVPRDDGGLAAALDDNDDERLGVGHAAGTDGYFGQLDWDTAAPTAAAVAAADAGHASGADVNGALGDTTPRAPATPSGTGAEQQRAWAEALDAWEEQTEAALRASADRLAKRPPPKGTDT